MPTNMENSANGHSKGQKRYGPNRKEDVLKKGGKNTQKNYTKLIFITPITTMVQSLD